jgi:ATP-dependent protease ClpP protease subunit
MLAQLKTGMHCNHTMNRNGAATKHISPHSPANKKTPPARHSLPSSSSNSSSSISNSRNSNNSLPGSSNSSQDEHRAFWQALPDHEFYGPRLQHLYFYADVDDESVLKLRGEVLEACRSVRKDDGTWVNPKPIIIHVHSAGGSIASMQWLLSLFNQVHVPLCVCVDAKSASAATALSIMAPYRVGTEHSLCLLHDYSAWQGGRREELLEKMRRAEMHRDTYKSLYIARTRMTDSEVEALLRRDKLLDAPTCLRLGVYDRVLRPDRKAAVRAYMSSSKMSKMPADNAPFFKTNWNRAFATCSADKPDEFPRSFDALLASEDQAKPVLYVTPGGSGECDDPTLSLAMIARIMSSPVPVIAIVDNIVTWWQMLPVLFCHRRFMYENAMLDSKLAYQPSWGDRLADIIHNAGIMRSLISNTVKSHATPSTKLVNEMFDRMVTLTAEECLANGLVDVVVPLSARARGGRGGKKNKAFQGKTAYGKST